MAIRAIFWRRFVKQNQFALNLALCRMAHCAAHICVGPCQRELCSFIVVERRGRPALIHMAIPAFGDSVLGHKLAAMRIRVAGFAIRRRSFELNLMRAGKRFVTFATSNRAVSSDQGKFCFRMVETVDVDPGARAVARFAAQSGSIGALQGHALLEFPFMGIGVACGAGAVLKMERKNFVRSSAESGFVALRAGHRHVGSGQYEAGVHVLGDGKSRAMKVLYSVAILATVLVGSGGKLLVMGVLMAIRACGELHFVDRILTSGRVTFVTSYCRMPSFQRIVRSRMFFNAKLRWLPAVDGMAFRTLALARARLELTLVRISSMTIDALGKGQLLLEIAAAMALAAADFQMRSQEGIFRFRMVELHRRIHFFPTGRCVAGFARSLERPLVRIRMAVAAGAEFDPAEFHGLFGAGREVAFLAGYLSVHADQRIFRFRMVELLGLLPVGHVVAVLAVGAELPPVDVLMAGHAFLREP